MLKIFQLYKFIDSIAPFATAAEFDNVGLIVGNMEDPVTGALIALDATTAVIEEAKKLGANTLITHHPIIFKPIKSIDSKSPLAMIIKNDFSLISAHTNLDIAKEGVNFCLAKKLKLKNINLVEPFGAIGSLETPFDNSGNFAEHVKSCLCAQSLRYTDAKKKIKSVFVCSGSGGDMVEKAFELKADVLVTGEIKHSDILKSIELGISIVDAGHFKTENVFIDTLKDKLTSEFPQINFFKSQSFSDNINYL